MRQARLALHEAGMLSHIDTAIDLIPDAAQREAVRIEWEYATVIDPSHPWVRQLGQAIGLSDAQTASLFRRAAAL
jgi:hypothetical protein